MFIGTRGSDRCGFEPIEDRVSTGVRSVVEASESDLMARGIAIDLLQMPKRVGPQYEAAEHKNMSGEESSTLDSVTIDDRRGHRAFCQRHSGTLNESTNVGVKTGGSRVGGPELCV